MDVKDDRVTGPRFLLVGVTAVLIDAGVYALLHGVLGSSGAKAAGYLAGAAFGYVANWKFTFGARRGRWTEITFVATYTASLLLNVGVNAAVLALLPSPAATPVAFFVATGASTVWNYVCLSRFVFKRAVPVGEGAA